MKNTRSADFCADQIDVITKFAVITYVIIKRVYCIAACSWLAVILYNVRERTQFLCSTQKTISIMLLSKIKASRADVQSQIHFKFDQSNYCVVKKIKTNICI